MLSTGQVLFKKAAISGEGDGLIGMFLNPWMFTALCLYGAATMLWVWILRTTPLSFAYPFVALGFIFVPAAASVFFAEELSWRYGLGCAMIIGGILTISTS